MISVDNFYKRSAKDYQGILSVNDSKWEEIWLNVYNSTKLRRLSWYTVAGNHDWLVKTVQSNIIYFIKINAILIIGIQILPLKLNIV